MFSPPTAVRNAAIDRYVESKLAERWVLDGEHVELPATIQRQMCHPVAHRFRKHVNFLRGTAR